MISSEATNTADREPGPWRNPNRKPTNSTTYKRLEQLPSIRYHHAMLYVLQKHGPSPSLHSRPLTRLVGWHQLKSTTPAPPLLRASALPAKHVRSGTPARLGRAADEHWL